LIGILRAEFDLVGIAQHVPHHSLAVDEGAVAAAAVLQPVLAAFGNNPSVRARNPAVANDQVVLRLPSNMKRQRLDLRA
jgi:hypothetical protein